MKLTFFTLTNKAVFCIFLFLSGSVAVPVLLAFSQNITPDNVANGISAHNWMPQLTNALNQIYSGQYLHVSWIRFNLTPINAKGEKLTDLIDWRGSYTNYTAAETNVITKESQYTNENIEVCGRKNDTYWSTGQKGMIDIDNLETNLTVQISRSAYAKEELTNVLSMGFGIHWDVNSIICDSEGHIHGKSKDLKDDINGTVEFTSEGNIKDCFYEVPNLKRQYLLSYSYDNSHSNMLFNVASITLSPIVPSLSPQYKYLKGADLIRYDIVEASPISSDDNDLKPIGIPPKELYKIAMISNGVTIPTQKMLTPKMLLESQPKPEQNKRPFGFGKRHLILGAIISVCCVTLLLVYQLFRSKK